MSKKSASRAAVAVGLAVALLSAPALAEPRHRHGDAGLQVRPAATGLGAAPWQAWAAGVVQPMPLVMPQNAPPEIIPPAPGDPAAPGEFIQPMPMPAVQKGAMPCCPTCGCLPPRKIDYRNHCRPPRKGECLCAPPIQTVLVVPDGKCGQCAVEVPVCLPACCTDAPQVEARRGLLGRTRVLYRWCCGFEVEVVFCCNGDLIVHYDER